MDISLSELGQFLPNSLLVVSKLEEPHLDIFLLDSLHEDEDLISTADTPREGADPEDFQLSCAGVLLVLDGVRESHLTQREENPVLKSESLEAEDDSVELVGQLPRLVGRVGHELDLLGIRQVRLVVVHLLPLLLQVNFLNSAEKSFLKVLFSGVDDSESLPGMLEAILAGDIHFYEVFLSELLRNDLVNVVLPLGGVEPHPEPHAVHVSRDVVQSNCGKFLGFLMVVLTKDTAMFVLHLGFISEP